MQVLHNLFDSIANYPKSSLLFVVAMCNLVWLFFILLNKKGWRQKIYRGYFVYAFFSIVWVISNAYFQSQFLTELSTNVAKSMALLANTAAAASSIGFYYMSCTVKDSTIPLRSWVLMGFLWIETFFFNLVPGLTVKDVLIFDDGSFQLIQGPWTGLFFLIGFITFLLSLGNFISAIRKNKVKIENVRVFYILFGMTLLYASIIIFLMILPYYFQNYQYAWIPPLMSLADVAIVGYAILTQRFIDIRTVISRFFKTIIAFSVSMLLIFPPLIKLAREYKGVSLRYWEIAAIALIILLYNKIGNFLNSRLFYRYFGGTEAEHLKYITNDLRKKNVVYTSVQDFERDLQASFRRKLRGTQPRIHVVDKSFKKDHPKLLQYYEKQSNVLITEELKFSDKNQHQMTPLLKELESLGGICVPLFNPYKGLVGIFTMGEKNYNHLYTKEEITALESLGALVSLTFNNILYSSELQAEVANKTKQLKKKIGQINHLVEQQSDFIAVTAHEFRTPLSIAAFLLEDVLHSQVNSEKKTEDLRVVEASLQNLKDLTEKLFAVQQYDLNKVSLNLQKIEMTQFVKGIFNQFQSIVKEKDQRLELFLAVNKKVYSNIDPVQLRQVLHNLLRNASKFAHEKGVIKIHVKMDTDKRHLLIGVEDNGPGIPNHLKKSIFEKFRTKSSGAGIGLGLYLCKKIVELHKGKIWVEDASGNGSIFCIQLNILGK